MDPSRLRALIAPAMASLFLVLSLCAFVVRRPESVGMRIPLVPLHSESHLSGVCNYMPIVLWLTADGKMWINVTEVSPDKLRARIAEIKEYSMDRRVYVVADPGVSYGKFADFLDRIVDATQNLQVVLLSGQLRREVEQGPTFEGLCVLESPEAQSPWMVNGLHHVR